MWKTCALVVFASSTAFANHHAKAFPKTPSKRAVARAVAAAHAGRAPTYVFSIWTEIGDGCKCPPWSFARTIDVMPRFKQSLPDPHATYTNAGEYRFLGHFDGRRITGLKWLAENHFARRDYVNEEDGDGDFREPAPSLIIEDWCLAPYFDGRDPEIIAQLRAEHRLCSQARSADLRKPTP